MEYADPLEAWVDESIRRSQAERYHPTEFIAMRARHGTVPAMERLMRDGHVQSGLRRLKELGMAQDWSIEAGILKFPSRFVKAARDAARLRLDHIDDGRTVVMSPTKRSAQAQQCSRDQQHALERGRFVRCLMPVLNHRSRSVPHMAKAKRVGLETGNRN